MDEVREDNSGVWRQRGDGTWEFSPKRKMPQTRSSLDHGSLSGLNDDDHLQYALVVIGGTKPTNPRPGTIYIPA